MKIYKCGSDQKAVEFPLSFSDIKSGEGVYQPNHSGSSGKTRLLVIRYQGAAVPTSVLYFDGCDQIEPANEASWMAIKFRRTEERICLEVRPS